jgi:hypothetical protein
MARPPFRSEVLFPGVIQFLCHSSCVIPSLCHSRAKRRIPVPSLPLCFHPCAILEPPRRRIPALFLLRPCPCVIQSSAKNPESGARNGGHSLRRGRKRCSAVEVFTNMFHVKRRLVQENKTRIVFRDGNAGLPKFLLQMNCLARSWGEAAPPARVGTNAAVVRRSKVRKERIYIEGLIDSRSLIVLLFVIAPRCVGRSDLALLFTFGFVVF